MAINFDLREKSSFMLDILHIFDSIFVALMLWLLANVHGVQWSEAWFYLGVGSIILSFVSFCSVNLYRPWRGIKLYKELFVILKAWIIFSGIILSLFFILKISTLYSRLIILSWLVVTPFAIFLVHLLVRKLMGILRKRGMNLRYAVIVGAGDLGLKLAELINDIPWAGIKIMGFFDDKYNGEGLSCGKYPVLGTLSNLQDYLNINQIDYVYIALPLRAELKIASILKNCRTFGAQLFLIPDLFTFDIYNAEFLTIGNMPIISFNPDYRWKRYFDILFSAIICLVSLPITLLLALLIKLNDGGPIFYGAKRISMAGKEFKCWKFRTMVVDADKKLAQILSADVDSKNEWDLLFKLKNDPRITKVGKFMRRFSLDELPQFINVMKGEMSIVGARPVELAQLVSHYKGLTGLYCSIKPGITGPWQVGPRSDMAHYSERVELDMWYLRNCSFLLDLKIIFRTIAIVFQHKGAY
jgi:putative colanic acid biosysnthesis UDP-glucose lipid carrier transferase